MQKEIWKDIKGYEGLYQASNLGRIKSVERKSPMPRNGENQYRRRRELILKPSIDKYGYYHVKLYNNGEIENIVIHQIIWKVFNGTSYDKKKYNIDHINNIKTDNHIENLQLLLIRDNISKGFQYKGKTLPPGVVKKGGKYLSRIQINKKLIIIGCFDDPNIAGLSYQKIKSKL